MEVRPQVKVGIVGAGFAGLAAAKRLLCNPRFHVTILEAASKVGGRVKSERFSGGHATELGCTFFYNYEGLGHSLAEFIKEKGFVEEVVQDFDELIEYGMPALRLLSNGEELPHDAVKHFQQVYWDISTSPILKGARDWKSLVESTTPSSSKDHEVGFEDFMIEKFTEVIRNDKMAAKKSGSWEPKHVLHMLNAYTAFLNGTKGSRNVDVSSMSEPADPDGQLILNCTSQEVADALAKDIPSHCFHFNQEVCSIRWTRQQGSTTLSHPVTIVCADGSRCHVDHVIVTASLGVLQHRCQPTSDPPLFDPQLPQDKLSAIMKLGMGQGCKVIVEFARPLVARDHRSIELYWLEEDGGYPPQYPWAAGQYILQRIGDSSIYVTWFVGEDAIAVENATKEEISEGICLVIEKFLKRPVDRPVRVEKSSWCSNKFFHGMYSYNATGSSGLDREVLARPVDGTTPLQLLLAGEATKPGTYSATVDAFETGLREADRLLQHYSQQ